MLKLLPILLFCVFSISCKKAIEKKKEQIVLDAVTNGLWVIELYSEDGITMTTLFNGYEFKFNENETLAALKLGAATQGTWKTDISQYSITTNFPGATEPLSNLNAIWKLTDSDWTWVKSESTVSGIKKILHLRKK
jgi:hypothetical protein